MIVPLLIGPKAKICAAAAQAQLDISPYELISTEHSEAAAALWWRWHGRARSRR